MLQVLSSETIRFVKNRKNVWFIVSEKLNKIKQHIPIDDFLEFQISERHWSISANRTILQFWVAIFANNMPIMTLINWNRTNCLKTNWTFQDGLEIVEMFLHSIQGIHFQRQTFFSGQCRQINLQLTFKNPISLLVITFRRHFGNYTAFKAVVLAKYIDMSFWQFSEN